MQRPKRQAAENALAKIRDIREWETLPETSQRFKECAALIDAELEAEIKKKKVKTCDLDTSETEEEESQDKFYDANDGFVIADAGIDQRHMVRGAYEIGLNRQNEPPAVGTHAVGEQPFKMRGDRFRGGLGKHFFRREKGLVEFNDAGDFDLSHSMPVNHIAVLPAAVRGDQALAPWHFLYFAPLPQGHGSLRPTSRIGLRAGVSA
jgi:hypothetical protein